MSEQKGAIAAGHEYTARAAETVLRAGGNAFDAVVAAHFAACVAEPVLSSLGGGGFLFAHTEHDTSQIYDFFVQTPDIQLNPDSLEFNPIHADFGNASQEFHIGFGSVATPGTVKGLFKIHQDLCTMPMRDLVQPAVDMAKSGIKINAFQAYIFDIIKPILHATQGSKNIFASPKNNECLIGENELLHLPYLADILENLAYEGDSLFYRGEIASQIDRYSKEHNGLIRRADLENYQVIMRQPLQIEYHQAKILTNPPPSSGGLLVAFALKLLETSTRHKEEIHSIEHAHRITKILSATNQARLDGLIHENPSIAMQLLDPAHINTYSSLFNVQANSGTTHISIMDSNGNFAGLTTSNGEGCGHILPGTDIMLNNMLGEEDLNKDGFHLWKKNCRMTSMMAPTLLIKDNNFTVLGSGGSNRIRSALFQVLVNQIDYDLDLEQSIAHPRLHIENDLLSIEGGFEQNVIQELIKLYPNSNIWNERNLFFGGVHSVQFKNGQFSGFGDPRRGGFSIVL